MGSKARTTREVIEDHLHRRDDADLDGDLRDNYAQDVILLSAEGVHHGHDGVRYLADILACYLPDSHFEYDHVRMEGRVGMLVWSGHGPQVRIHDGVDSYLVEDGLIRAQTIHYSSADESSSG